MYIGLHVKYSLFLSDFNEARVFSQQILEKYSNNKIYDPLSTGSRVVPSGWTDRQTDG